MVTVSEVAHAVGGLTFAHCPANFHTASSVGMWLSISRLDSSIPCRAEIFAGVAAEVRGNSPAYA